MSKKFKHGDTVCMKRNPSAVGNIISVDSSALPYYVSFNYGCRWVAESEIELVLRNVCVSTEPMLADGNMRGEQFVIPDVDVTKPIPVTGLMYGFAGICQLKDVLQESLDGYFPAGADQKVTSEYKYVYYMRGDEIVQMSPATFAKETPHTVQLELGVYYRLEEDYTFINGEVVQAGAIMVLERQEPEEYTGFLPYNFRLANHEYPMWFGRVNVTKL